MKLEHRRRLLLALASVFVAGLAFGCGQKGPLYLPEEEEDEEKKEQKQQSSRWDKRQDRA